MSETTRREEKERTIEAEVDADKTKVGEVVSHTTIDAEGEYTSEKSESEETDDEDEES
jgi:hypothetical protein